MKIARTTSPAVDFITSTEVEDQLSISTGYDSAKVARVISAAQDYVETYTDRAMINQTWTMKLDKFPEVIYIPKGIVQSITSVTYTDSEGDSQTLVAGTDYYLSNTGDLARLVPVTSWPTPDTVRKEVVSVVWVGGYGAAATDVAGWAKEAALAYAVFLYELKPEFMDLCQKMLYNKRLYFNYSIND